MSVYTNNNFTYAGYDFDAARDPFEFELNSSKYVARGFVFDQKFVLEFKLEWITPVSTSWASSWSFLKDYGIKNVLRITLNQLYADLRWMRPLPKSTPIMPINDENIARHMEKALLVYEKLWGRDHFQIIILADSKERFIQTISKGLEKIPGISIHRKLSTEFMDIKPSSDVFYIVLKNAYGGNIKEDTQMSGAFAAVPADAKHNWKKDGEEINQQAEDSLIAMGMKPT